MDPNETPEPRSNNSRVLLWVALVLVLLGINGVLFYLNQQKGQQNEVLTTEVKAKDSKLQEQIKQYEALKADFERQSQELQALGLSNDSLVAKISAVNADLLKLRSFKAGSFSSPSKACSSSAPRTWKANCARRTTILPNSRRIMKPSTLKLLR